MDNVVPLHRETAERRKVNEQVVGEVAMAVRTFFHTTWLGDDTWADPEGLEQGRQLVVDFALHTAASQEDGGTDLGQDLTLTQVARVLQYIGCVEVREGCSCYGCSGDQSTIGKTEILMWAMRQVERHAAMAVQS